MTYGGRQGGSAPGFGHSRGAGRDGAIPGPDEEFKTLLKNVSLSKPDAALFDTIAQKIALQLSDSQVGKRNKSSQIRRFFDDVTRYADRHRSRHRLNSEEKFKSDLPFIRLICAHASYAYTREHVDANFVAFMQEGLRQVEDAQTLLMFRTLFEAVIGFSPKRD